MTAYPDTLLFDGIDISTATGIFVVSLDGLFAPGTRRGSHDTIPGRPGQIGAQLPVDAYAFSVPIIVDGAGRSGMIANLQALIADMAGTDGLGQLERRLASDENGGYDAYTASGQFAALNTFSLLNPQTGQTELQFVNLDGRWKRSSDGVWVLP